MPIDTSTEIRAEDRFFTSHEVANILGVTPSSVIKWINRGILKAFSTPGGHRRVSATNLVQFARDRNMPIPRALQALTVTKVLALDDEPRFLSALRGAFRPYADEFQLSTVDDGVDALVLVGSLKPEVLLLDLQMPGLDGLHVLARLKANPDTNAMIIVVISGGLDEATEKQCKELGATMCLSKPFKNSELLQALRELRKPAAG